MYDETTIHRDLYFCEVCGSPDLEVSAWVHLNKWEITDGEGPLTTVFCPDCQEHFKRYDEITITPEYSIVLAAERARKWCDAYHGELDS